MNILCKLLSGRFILTVIVGITFATLSIMGILSPSQSMEVILLVIYGYFTKPRDKEQPKQE